ncbi:MAG: YtxH domain-containing protein [Actinomycetaceae bacterium]|nr:YtxH domain-containing protein [Actinomycetaceae bacterium]
MGNKFGFIVGAGLGYVLGTKAGRERYEQIRQSAAKLRQSPVVAKPMNSASDKISEAVRRGGEAATDKVVGIVKERVFGQRPDDTEYVDVDVVEVYDTEAETTPGQPSA